MNIVTVKSEGLAHNSYYLSDGTEAVVIDPRRDCKVYTQLAKEECARITYILETHRNEDFVVGSRELQVLTEAEIGHSEALPFKYGEHRLKDGDSINVGSLRINSLHTPGHTDESLCYTVYLSENPKEPSLVFTGDTLFAGSVGRTDLYGARAQEDQAKKLYESLSEKLLVLGDHVLIYPAHGSGSICGGNIGSLEISTLGYERKTNPYLRLDESAFIERSQSEELVVPQYFRKMEQLNLEGPPLLSDMASPKPMSVSDFEDHMAEPDMLVVDTRNAYAFAGSHIPNSLSIWLGGTSVYPGWILPIDQYVIFVLERSRDIEKVTARFNRLGFDNLCGYLCPGLNEWQENGKSIESLCTISVQTLKKRLSSEDVLLIDVREPHEWRDGYIEGAELMFFGDLEKKVGILDRNKPLAVICSAGNRSSIGASILKRKGFKQIYNVLGGMTAWDSLDYPTKKP